MPIKLKIHDGNVKGKVIEIKPEYKPMTKLKCPFCVKELQLALNVDGREFYWCENYDCDGVNYGVGNKELWQALTDTKKKLDIAKSKLNGIHRLYSHAFYNREDWLQVCMEMVDKANIALEQIKQKEEK